MRFFSLIASLTVGQQLVSADTPFRPDMSPCDDSRECFSQCCNLSHTVNAESAPEPGYCISANRVDNVDECVRSASYDGLLSNYSPKDPNDRIKLANDLGLRYFPSNCRFSSDCTKMRTGNLCLNGACYQDIPGVVHEPIPEQTSEPVQSQEETSAFTST